MDLLSFGIDTDTLSVTDAAARGVAGLVRDAETGPGVIIERHGRPAAAVVSIPALEGLQRIAEDLADAVVVLARVATDNGNRTDLDDVIAGFGHTRAELEAELDADLAVTEE